MLILNKPPDFSSFFLEERILSFDFHVIFIFKAYTIGIL